MRKAIVFMFVAAFCAVSTFAAALTLVTPDGGGLCLGRTYNITWTATDLPAGTRVKLVLFQGDTKIGTIAQDLDPGASPYRWTVGRHEGGTAASGGRYRIRLRTMDNAVEDFDNAPFSITACSSPAVAIRDRTLSTRPFSSSTTTVRVTYPNGGERLVIGVEATIAWECTNPRPGQFLKISLVTHAGSPFEEIFNLGNMPIAAGSYTWDITALFKANYDSLIRLSPTVSGDFTPDNSDRILALTYPNTTVRILAPNDDESFPGNRPINIRWEATNTKPWQCFKISLVHMDSACAHPDYSYAWGICPIDRREAQILPEAYTREFSGLWKIAITVLIDGLPDARGYDPVALDESDACFRIR